MYIPGYKVQKRSLYSYDGGCKIVTICVTSNEPLISVCVFVNSIKTPNRFKFVSQTVVLMASAVIKQESEIIFT